MTEIYITLERYGGSLNFHCVHIEKNYQQFRVTDDRNIRLTFSGTETH